jgi:hypothetical protein
MDSEGLSPLSNEPSITPQPKQDQSSPNRPNLSLQDPFQNNQHTYDLAFLDISFFLSFWLSYL